MRSPTEIGIEYLRDCLRYEPDTGLIYWLERPVHHFSSTAARGKFNARYANKVAGSNDGAGYVRITVTVPGEGPRHLRGHRIGFALHTGAWPKIHLDHIDGDRSNNRIANLRESDDSQNMRNSPARPTNKTGFKGVCYLDKVGRYRAQIMLKGRQHFLGEYATPEEAYKKYCEAAERLHGNFANTTCANQRGQERMR